MKKYKRIFGFMKADLRGEWVHIRDIVSLLHPIAYAIKDDITKKKLRDILEHEIWETDERIYAGCIGATNCRVAKQDVYVNLKDNDDREGTYLRRKFCYYASPSGRSHCLLEKGHEGKHTGYTTSKSGDPYKTYWD